MESNGKCMYFFFYKWLPQGQYVYIHHCVRDVLRARKLRCEQENLLYPIYENFNPEYFRGKQL